MAHLEMTSVAQQIETLFDAGSMTGLTDAQLLERFNFRRDACGEAAFAELVTRHGPMVLGVCTQLLDDRHQAEDAFQATFLVLARKARSISRSDRLGNWLYGVALRTARSARGRLARRRRHEEVSAMNQPGSHIGAEPTVPPAEEAIMAREHARLLHAEIARLPDAFRSPVVLCYLEGLSVNEAALRLQLSDGTVRSRMARAREKLRRALVRRGIVAPAAALVSLLDVRPAQASVSSALFNLTTRAAIHFAAGSGVREAVSASTAALAQEVLRSMLVQKVMVVALAIVFLVAAAGSAGLVARSLAPRSEPDKRSSDPSSSRVTFGSAVSPPQVVATPTTPPSAARTLRVVVLDPSGKPISGARVKSGIWTVEKDFKHNRDYETDASGAALIELPKTFTIVRLWTSKQSFVSMFAHWEENDLASGKRIPDVYPVRLERGVSASGRIVDENDKPIAGAKVQVTTQHEDLAPARADTRTRYNSWLAIGANAAVTDAHGRWRINDVPNHPKVELTLLVTHPGYVSDENWGQTQRACAITTAMLLNGTATLKLKAGAIVQGRVTDSAGNPVAGAIVVKGDDPYFGSTPSEFQTDAEGRFRLPALASQPTALTVIAPGWAPQERLVKVHPGLPAQDFRMERGKPVRLRVVDTAGKPVPNANVNIRGWKGRQALHNHDHPNVRDTKIPRRTDSNGVWEWTWSPESPVELAISAVGFANQELQLAGGQPERTIALKSEHRVTGRVTDAATGQSIPAFTVIPVDVFRKDWFVAEPNNSKPGKDGHLDYLATRADIPIRVRVEAMGYRAMDGPVFRLGDDGARTQDFRLQPSPPRSGLIVDAAGRPAPNVVRHWRRPRRMRVSGRTRLTASQRPTHRDASRSPIRANCGELLRDQTRVSPSANSRPIATMRERSSCNLMRRSAVSSAMPAGPCKVRTSCSKSFALAAPRNRSSTTMRLPRSPARTAGLSSRAFLRSRSACGSLSDRGKTRRFVPDRTCLSISSRARASSSTWEMLVPSLPVR